MSIQQNFPAISPSLNLNFARSKTLDPRITFSRTTTATRVNEQGLIEVVSADIPRFDHEYDASTGVVKSLGLLVEEERTNSLYYSNDFSQDPPVGSALQGWTKQNSHPVPTQDVVGPDGVSNSGWRFYRTSTNQYIYQQVVGAGTHTLSAWVRSSAATGSFTMQAYNSIDGGMSQELTATNEWQRFSITISPTTTTSYYPCVPANTNEDFYVWGAQLELNKSFETSYIPTSGGTATREPDNVSMTGDNFSDWYNQDEGTIYVRHKTFLSSNPYNRIWAITDGSASNVYAIYYPALSTKIDPLKTISGSQNFASGPSNANGHNNFNNTIFSYDKDTTNIIVNGGNATTLSVSGELNLIRLNIGGNEYNSFTYNHISQLTYYPVRLPNSTLQTLTK